jgi:hypothetical protein
MMNGADGEDIEHRNKKQKDVETGETPTSEMRGTVLCYLYQFRNPLAPCPLSLVPCSLLLI